MPDTVTQAYIFVPMLVVVLLTFIAFLRMGQARGAVMKEGGVTVEYYRAHIGGSEPEYAVTATRHYGNMFEMPTLFYAGCITAYALGAVGFWTVLFAWGFVFGRLIQSLVHMTYNNPAHRGYGFMLAVIFSFALWVNIAMSVFARL